MHFAKSVDYQEGQRQLLELLRRSLKKGPVLWIVAGGSIIPIIVNILNGIDEEQTKRLDILLSDERYGPKGHKDSNYAQIMKAGLNLKQASFRDILDPLLSPKQSLELFSNLFEVYKKESSTTVAQLGIGEDGHIAGVLPGSPGVTSPDIAVYYESDPFKRITLTLETLKSLDTARIFCFGQNKSQALNRLREGQEALGSLPCLILKEIADVTVYNDQLEG